MKVIKPAKTRDASTTRELRQNVADMIETVREKGDQALMEYSRRFDASQRDTFRVSAEEIKEAYSQVSQDEIDDLQQAAHNIREFALAQRQSIQDLPLFEPRPGVQLGHRVIPVDSCLCYVPGGGYPLYSTALMLAIPAKTAGVKRVAACSPVVKGSGHIYNKTVVAMDIAGVDEIYALGGAQAVAAFAYGTGQIQPVDLIVGPGNSYVTEAKRQCYGQVGLDFVAGPSEVLVIADHSADPTLIAADLLAQSEHDLVAKGILVTTDEKLGQDVIHEVETLLKQLSTKEIAAASWRDYGEVLLADSMDEAIEISNKLAPEHLEIQLENHQPYLDSLTNYGSLFIGGYTAEVFGDYASGTNHTLPTMRAARYTGGVYVGTFLKTCTHQQLTQQAMLDMAPLVSRLANGEGLAAHALAADLRIQKAGK